MKFHFFLISLINYFTSKNRMNNTNKYYFCITNHLSGIIDSEAPTLTHKMINNKLLINLLDASTLL